MAVIEVRLRAPPDGLDIEEYIKTYADIDVTAYVNPAAKYRASSLPGDYLSNNRVASKG